jgi:Tfp pilus assembly protein PilF
MPQTSRTETEQSAPVPDVVGLLFKRANVLRLLGRDGEARDAYLELLNRQPGHAGALNNLGNLLLAAGDKEGARRLYSEALSAHPDDPLTLVNLAILLLQDEKLEEARAHFEHALKVDPGNRQAHIGMSFVRANLEDPEKAAWHRRIAFQGRCVIALPYRGKQPPITVLELVSSPEGNSKIHDFLSDQIFQKYIVVTEFYDPRTPLPPHQLVVNAISDAEVASAALVGARSLLAHTMAPVINSPGALFATGRGDVARRLSRIPGVRAPKTITLSRESLAAPGCQERLALMGFQFPLLLRSPGFHGGKHFMRVESFEELPPALAQLPGVDLIVIQYLDARGPDGKTRKYRVMMIDGQLYALHAAISSQWKVHYYSADMADYPEHRAEDAAFLAGMPGVLGPAAMAALAEIQKTLELDYGGIDFGLNEKGEILLFEANAMMAVIPPDADQRWDYRRPATEQIYKAVLTMLTERAKPPGRASL